MAHEAPPIAPTRLEFDATQAPKNCNDEILFRNLLMNWLPYSAFSLDVGRRLTVRVHRTPTGSKEWDVMLTDAMGATIKERHERYGAKTECYKVLYEAAYAAATLLGAFEKPPAPEPCPICPSPPTSPGPAHCPENAAPVPIHKASTSVSPRQTAVPQPAGRRAYVGAGVLFGTGIKPQGAIGPYVVLGFVPSRHSPQLQVEFAGAWTAQGGTDANATMDVIPMFGSICYSRAAFHVCSGITTTFFSMEQANNNADSGEFRANVAGHLRLGTEFDVAGPLSIRVDVFAQMRFAGQTFAQGSSPIDTQSPVDLGAMAMGLWSLD